MNNKRYKLWVFIGCLFAFSVIALGAYTRLSDAGLGCPDWPGCYGFLTVPKENHEVIDAMNAFPGQTFESEKAWKEMIHRYFAGGFGVFILFIGIWSMMRRRHQIVPVKLPLLLLVLVCFQALLGMLTVTMQLQPVIVMGHLLGGFSLLTLLFLLYLRITCERIPGGDSGAKPFFTLSVMMLLMVVLQIALGGWLAANYSASHCIDLPLCGEQTFTRFSLREVFQLPAENVNYEYGVLSADARMSIHFLHRVWALVVTLFLLVAGWRIFSNCYSSRIKQAVMQVWLILLLQLSLGFGLVYFSFPLLLALSHNLVAALLLLSVTRLAYLIGSKS